MPCLKEQPLSTRTLEGRAFKFTGCFQLLQGTFKGLGSDWSLVKHAYSMILMWKVVGTLTCLNESIKLEIKSHEIVVLFN